MLTVEFWFKIECQNEYVPSTRANLSLKVILFIRWKRETLYYKYIPRKQFNYTDTMSLAFDENGRPFIILRE